VDPGDPPGLLALQDAIPNCLHNIAPEPGDIDPDILNIARLEKAFAAISRRRTTKERKRLLVTISGSGASVAGHVFLHQSKVSGRIRDLLLGYNLVHQDATEISETVLNSDGFLVVDQQASQFVLTLVAGRLACRLGLDAVTDSPLFYGVNAAESLDLNSSAFPGAAEGALVGAIASLLIPNEIATLRVTDYQRLRDSYSEIRGAFRSLVSEMTTIHRLGRISDFDTLNSRINTVAAEFVAEVTRFQKTRYARAFRDWAPLCIGGLLSAVSSFVSPVASIGIAGASLLIQVIEKNFDSSAIESNRQRVFQLMTGLRHDVLQRAKIRALV
jgi:hypothetical protein